MFDHQPEEHDHDHEQCEHFADDWMKTCKNRVEQAGHKVLMSSPFCKSYLAAHENKCTGCSSEQGCSRVHHMMMATIEVHKAINQQPDPSFIVASAFALKRIHDEIVKDGVIKQAKPKDGLSKKGFDDLI